MSTNAIKARVQVKADISTNWQTAGDNGFIPLKREPIFYTDTGQIKLGDGVTNVNLLPVFMEGVNLEDYCTKEELDAYKEQASMTHSNLMLSISAVEMEVLGIQQAGYVTEQQVADFFAQRLETSVFVSTAEPTQAKTGDLWFDTSDIGTLYIAEEGEF